MMFERLKAAIADWGTACDVILVDDGSTDGTWELMQGFHREDPRWRAIRLSRNFGHQVALWAGLRHVTGDVIAVLDADLQDPPEVVRQFLDKWVEGHDVVYAIRTKRKEGPFKRMGYAVFYRVLALLSEIEIPLDSGDFCVIDRHVLDQMTIVTDQQPFARGLRAWVGFNHVGVPYERHERAAGQPKYTFAKLVQLALNGIFSFSTMPLRLATYLGFIVSAFAFMVAAFSLARWVFASQFEAMGMGPTTGMTSIVMGIMFLGGVQLVCIGILGEYVGRIYENVKGRPQYTVRERLGYGQPGSVSGRMTE